MHNTFLGCVLIFGVFFCTLALLGEALIKRVHAHLCALFVCTPSLALVCKALIFFLVWLHHLSSPALGFNPEIVVNESG